MAKSRLLELKTDLRDLSYADTGTKSPYVAKPLPGYNEQGSKTTQINARVDDLTRFTEVLTSAPGLKYISNQTLLKQEETRREYRKAKESGKTALGSILKAGVSSLLTTAKTTASLLAQVPVNGTGTHFILGFGGREYLQQGAAPTTPLGQFLRNTLKIGGGINGGQKALNGETIIIDFDAAGTIKGNGQTSELEARYKNNTPPTTKLEFEPLDYSKDKTKSIVLKYNPGKKGRNLTDKTVSQEIDEVNVKGVEDLAKVTAATTQTSPEDIIPFYFNIFTPSNTKGYNLYFRAFLNGLNDNFNGEWAGTKYIGRAEDFYTYQGFKRDITFSFVVAALSRAELIPLYQKLNALTGATAPTYSKQGNFMQGTLASVTIGDYLNNLNGTINTVGLAWNKSYQWEIDYEEKGILVVPHVLDVTISFTPIHDFNVEFNTSPASKNFIGGDRQLKTDVRTQPAVLATPGTITPGGDITELLNRV